MRKLIFVLAAAILAVPPTAAQAESTPTELYFHVFNTFDRFPINTQPMDVEFFEVGGTNFPTLAAQGWDFNTIYGYSTAGPVEYDYIENGRPRFHPERGIAADVELDESVQPVVYLYIDVRDVIANDAGPMLLPAYTLEVTVRTGDNPGDTAELDMGDLLMHGKLTAHVFDGHTLPVNDLLDNQTGPDGHPILIPDSDGIVEYAIPMTVSQWTLPKRDAFNVRIDWYQDPADQGEDQMATGWMRLSADADRLPRMEVAVKNPVYVEFVHPQVAAGTLLIHTGVNSPWGTYDIDVSNMKLTVKDAAGNVVKQHTGTDGDLERFASQGTHVHDQHDKAAEITYMWDFRAEGAKDGTYAIELEVPNLDNTATARSTASFTIEGKKAFGQDDTGQIVEPAEGDGDDKKTPAAGLLVVLAALLLAGRRRA